MPQVAPSSKAEVRWVEKLTPNGARLVLLGLVAVAALLVWVATGITEPARRAGPSDLDTYERVVAALRAGQGYYPALHQALLDGGYGTLSPLNWRTPAFLSFLSWFPSLDMAQWALGGLTFVAWGLAVAFVFRVMRYAGAIGAGIVMAASLIAIAAPRAELSFELCAGTLILISVSAYGLGWRWAGVLAGVLALLVRELAVIYVLVCLGVAIREKRWREAAAWVLVLVAFGAFYVWHWAQLGALIGAEDHAAATGWLQFGGLVFVLRTEAFNGLLLVAPYWVAAIVLLIGLVGLKSLPRPAITVALYLLLFVVYGRPENDYWGALYAPLVALGLVFAPAVLMAIARRSVGASADQPPPVLPLSGGGT
jgi:hypothetical protein